MPVRKEGGGGGPVVDDDDQDQPSPAEVVYRKGGGSAPRATAAQKVTYSLQDRWNDIYDEFTQPDLPGETPGGELFAARTSYEQMIEASQSQTQEDFYNDRLRHFSTETVNMSPEIVFAVASSQTVDENQVAQIAQHLGEVSPWVMKHNKFAGRHGTLDAATAWALATGNADALKFLEAIKIMPALSQDMIFRVLADPSLLTQDVVDVYNAAGEVTPTGAVGRAAPPEPMAIPGMTQAEVAAFSEGAHTMKTEFGLHIMTDPATGRMIFSWPNEDKSVDLQAAIKTLFPQASQLFKVGVPSLWEQYLANPLSGTAKAVTAVLTTAAKPFEGAIWALKEWAEAGASTGVDIYSLATPGEVSAETRASFVGGVGKGFVKPITAPFELLHQGTRFTVQNSLGLLWKDNPDKEAIDDAAASLLDIFLLGKIGTGMRAFKEGRRGLGELRTAEAKLGVAESVTEKAFGSGQILSSKWYAHPNRLADYYIKKAGLELAEIMPRHVGGSGRLLPYERTRGLRDTLERWEPAQKAFDNIAEISRRYPDVDARVGAST